MQPIILKGVFFSILLLFSVGKRYAVCSLLNNSHNNWASPDALSSSDFSSLFNGSEISPDNSTPIFSYDNIFCIAELVGLFMMISPSGLSSTIACKGSCAAFAIATDFPLIGGPTNTV